eukprot:TRINITY_DN20731_c0_g1_i1.p1 TRINITY_DN20731_c0_g1~~TRINITY_DN20731_c0_g1_i1.p1  ORF type:complete len:550 (+),score=162.59 TRINITY_DN20731_c0_g1_i1:65-1651(+)
MPHARVPPQERRPPYEAPAVEQELDVIIAELRSLSAAAAQASGTGRRRAEQPAEAPPPEDRSASEDQQSVSECWSDAELAGSPPRPGLSALAASRTSSPAKQTSSGGGLGDTQRQRQAAEVAELRERGSAVVSAAWRRMRLTERPDAPPPPADPFRAKCGAAVRLLNSTALRLGRLGPALLPAAAELLAIAEEATRADSHHQRGPCYFASQRARLQLRSAAYTNRASVLRAEGDLGGAAQSLKCAAEIERSVAGGATVAPETLLSIAALCTQDERPREAMRCCHAALHQLKRMRAQRPPPQGDEAGEPLYTAARLDYLLAVAWHNLGAAQRAAELRDPRAAAPTATPAPSARSPRTAADSSATAASVCSEAALHRISARSFANAHRRARLLRPGGGEQDGEEDASLGSALAASEPLLPPLRDARRLPQGAGGAQADAQLPAVQLTPGFLAGVPGARVAGRRGHRCRFDGAALLADPSARSSAPGQQRGWDGSGAPPPLGKRAPMPRRPGKCTAPRVSLPEVVAARRTA